MGRLGVFVIERVTDYFFEPIHSLADLDVLSAIASFLSLPRSLSPPLIHSMSIDSLARHIASPHPPLIAHLSHCIHYIGGFPPLTIPPWTWPLLTW